VYAAWRRLGYAKPQSGLRPFVRFWLLF